jgi:hypothetical protein
LPLPEALYDGEPEIIKDEDAVAGDLGMAAEASIREGSYLSARTPP